MSSPCRPRCECIWSRNVCALLSHSRCHFYGLAGRGGDDDAAGGSDRRAIERQFHRVRAGTAQRVGQRPVIGLQVADADDAIVGEPRFGYPGSEHQRLVRVPLVREQTHHGEHVLGTDPRMRNVAKVTGASRVAPRDLWPLVPRARAAVTSTSTSCTRTASGSSHVANVHTVELGATDAALDLENSVFRRVDLIGGVVGPFGRAVAPRTKSCQVLLVRGIELSAR